MIPSTFSFLASEISKMLTDSFPDKKYQVVVDVPGGSAHLNQSNSGYLSLSLLNFEEDRISRIQDKFLGNDRPFRHSPVQMNLYLLIGVTNPVYMEALVMLNAIIQFFQLQPVFARSSHPTIDKMLIKLSVEFYTMSIEQVQSIRTVVGIGNVPMILYKLRLTGVNESFKVSEQV